MTPRTTYRKFLFIVTLLAFAFSGTSCSTIKARLHRGYVEESVVKKEIDKLNADHEVAVGVAEQKVATAKDAVIGNQDLQLQTVANSLYGADLAFSFYTPPEPSRVDLIVNNRVTEAAAATGKKATAEAMEKENTRLKKELDEKITSLEDLKAMHDIVIKSNIRISSQSDLLKKELEGLKRDITKLNEDHKNALILEQDKLILKQAEINALEKERGDDKEWIRLVKLKAMAVCGLLSLACVAGAIWSPVFKSKFVIGATIFGSCAGLIMFVQPWMIAAGVGAAMVGVIVKMTYEHHAVDKTATNLINYVEDQKQNTPIAYEKEKLADYNGQYVTSKTGKVTVVPDPDVEKVIEQKLKDSQRI